VYFTVRRITDRLGVQFPLRRLEDSGSSVKMVCAELLHKHQHLPHLSSVVISAVPIFELLAGGTVLRDPVTRNVWQFEQGRKILQALLPYRSLPAA
jgi:hypothetical protein